VRNAAPGVCRSDHAGVDRKARSLPADLIRTADPSIGCVRAYVRVVDDDKQQAEPIRPTRPRERQTATVVHGGSAARDGAEAGPFPSVPPAFRGGRSRGGDLR